MCVIFSVSEIKQNVNNQIFGCAKLIHLPITYLVPCLFIVLTRDGMAVDNGCRSSDHQTRVV
jgi:hypothetical protein